jgi:hypothetical protein
VSEPSVEKHKEFALVGAMDDNKPFTQELDETNQASFWETSLFALSLHQE